MLKPSLRPFDQQKPLPASLQSREGWAEMFEARRTAEPHLHQIEPTNHCPYSCVMCPRSEKMTRPLGFMEMDLYRKVIDEVATYGEPVRSKEIELFHFGESLLHPEIDKMVGHASHKGLHATLSVNPPHLTPDLSRRLLENNPFRIILSLDGVDQKSYRAVRGAVADFDKAVRHIEHLASLRKAMNSSAIITVRIIRMCINEGEISSFREGWREKGVEVEVRPFFPWGEKEMAELGAVERYPPYMPCPFPWQYVVVQWNGDVVPCCRDHNGVLSLGNVKNGTLKEIWNGGKSQDFRRRMATGTVREKSCRDCLAIYYTDPEKR